MSASWQWAKANPDTAARLIRELQRENAALRNEIGRLNGQTNWVCKCGGTDCEGRKENAALREQVEHLIGMIEQLEGDLAHFATVEAFEGKKEAQP